MIFFLSYVEVQILKPMINWPGHFYARIAHISIEKYPADVDYFYLQHFIQIFIKMWKK